MKKHVILIFLLISFNIYAETFINEEAKSKVEFDIKETKNDKFKIKEDNKDETEFKQGNVDFDGIEKNKRNKEKKKEIKNITKNEFSDDKNDDNSKVIDIDELIYNAKFKMDDTALYFLDEKNFRNIHDKKAILVNIDDKKNEIKTSNKVSKNENDLYKFNFNVLIGYLISCLFILISFFIFRKTYERFRKKVK